jgi:iron complex transport system ATP-binding protein
VSSEALAAENVSFAYHAAGRVLDGVSATIVRGGLVGILGPNGSGKTTLLRLLGGLFRPSEGRICLDGLDLRSLPRARIARRIAMVPQETQLAFDYTVLEMATMGRYPHLGAFEIEGPDDIEIAREALRATGTGHLESRPFNMLSGGEKQRVVIAGALAQKPDILLLDEPTASLDLAYQLEVRTILHTLNRDRNLTIVVSTHDLNFAASLCKELVLLHQGRVLAAGPAAAMLDPSLIGNLYGVEVDITQNARTGQLTVVPVERGTESRRP